MDPARYGAAAHPETGAPNDERDGWELALLDAALAAGVPLLAICRGIQLLNVVRGDMSLVGPRPPLPEEVEGYSDDAVRRLKVKPGVTGLWQVSGRSNLSWEESLRLDLRYTDNWSLALDLSILWRTLRAVIRGSGAY